MKTNDNEADGFPFSCKFTPVLKHFDMHVILQGVRCANLYQIVRGCMCAIRAHALHTFTPLNIPQINEQRCSATSPRHTASPTSTLSHCFSNLIPVTLLPQISPHHHNHTASPTSPPSHCSPKHHPITLLPQLHPNHCFTTSRRTCNSTAKSRCRAPIIASHFCFFINAGRKTSEAKHKTHNEFYKTAKKEMNNTKNRSARELALGIKPPLA